ncbi:hypothetical protein KIPB_003446 [Kipferlia bialata]|uniref:RNase III domain-containing protein n=1 Tax=Kipferlia bialata TaxID=797122 RepID=A0A9K3CUF8_9EUKA|nr:hypothetical protein KIPB_003446 [Kipferlia bialata]|eukprot:g3446.t1
MAIDERDCRTQDPHAHSVVDAVASVTGHTFRDTSLLHTAFTHSSWIASQELSLVRTAHSYNRLEFLGDSTLGAVIAQYLYEKFPGKPEGVLTKDKSDLVCNTNLARIMEENGLLRFCRVGNGTTLQQKMKADFLEALVGAIMLDGGWDAACVACRSLLHIEGGLVVPSVTRTAPLVPSVPEDTMATLQRGTQTECGVSKGHLVATTTSACSDDRSTQTDRLGGALVSRRELMADESLEIRPNEFNIVSARSVEGQRDRDSVLEVLGDLSGKVMAAQTREVSGGVSVIHNWAVVSSERAVQTDRTRASICISRKRQLLCEDSDTWVSDSEWECNGPDWTFFARPLCQGYIYHECDDDPDMFWGPTPEWIEYS